jgi:hypothetical protein
MHFACVFEFGRCKFWLAPIATQRILSRSDRARLVLRVGRDAAKNLAVFKRYNRCISRTANGWPTGTSTATSVAAAKSGTD